MAALRQAGFPQYSDPFLSGLSWKLQIRAKLDYEARFSPSTPLMKKARQADADARDAPEQRVLTWSKCTDWYLRSTVRPTASLPSDLNRETMHLVPEQTASEFRRGPNK